MKCKRKYLLIGCVLLFLLLSLTSKGTAKEEEINFSTSFYKVSTFPSFPSFFPVDLTLRPEGDGVSTNLTPTGEVSNYLCVDDVTSDDDISYVINLDTGFLTDTYATTDHTSELGNINSITVYVVVKIGTSGGDAQIVLRSGGVDYPIDITPTTTYASYSYQWTTNPADSQPWDWLDIDAMEIGVASSGGGGPNRFGRVTQVYAVVNYEFDDTDPSITSPIDYTYELGSTSNTISWTVTEANPNNYIIYRNGSNVENGAYSDGTPVVHNCDGLGLGIYNFTFWADDDSTNEVSDTMWLTVEDTTNPNID
ncbi:MAG: hypothetical protein KAR35_08955, partial [Candidatus Heimdallarchaeota archaeon]|nr:hypothetical protein [Candidatus Heimdallarchaeota archaeon]MCK5049485.1 hypothetical protein [Candidatus Heimdallarchaeota archaeon]